MEDDFITGSSRNVEHPSTEGVEHMLIYSEGVPNVTEVGDTCPKQDPEMFCDEDEQCPNDGQWVPVNNKQDILSLDLASLGPEVLCRCHFPGLEVAYLFYNWYGRMNGFSARKGKILKNINGDSTQQEFMCHRQGFRKDNGVTIENRKRRAKPETRHGCLARFRVHVDENSQRWYVTCFDDEHNHEPLGVLYRGMLPAHRKMTDGDIVQMNNLRKVGIGAPDIYNSFANICGGYGKVGFRKKDIYNQIGTQRRLRGSDSESAVEYLRWLALKDPLMFVRHTEDLEGRLQHLFWCDGTSQLDYEVFGDVVAFDATYGKNKYHCPIVVFSGVNNHNHTVVFASAMIANETEQNYAWLLEQFTEAMKGKMPTSVITDGDKAMRNAIRTVFPNAHHRLCAWHLLRNATSNIGVPLFVAKFRKCMLGDYDVGQFKHRWNSLVAEYGLEQNNWVAEMYEKRHMWATAYVRGNFFAGFRTTSRCEGFHSLMGKFVRVRHNLTDFIQHFQRCLNYLRFKEIEADFATVHGEPVLQSNFKELERSAARVLTKEIFELFIEVLDRATVMNVTACKETGGQFIYKVVKYRVTGMEWHVTQVSCGNEFRCSCQMMESFGLPCGHVIAVLVYLNIGELPGSLVLGRWSKNAKDIVQGPRANGSSFWDSHVVARYVSLLDSCRELCTLASQSGEDFNYVRDKVNSSVLYLQNKNGNEDNSGQIIGSDGGLRDPVNLERNVGGSQRASTSGLKSKRTTKCGACKVPGHNRLTCPLLRQFDYMVENAYGGNLSAENEDISFDNNDFDSTI